MTRKYHLFTITIPPFNFLSDLSDLPLVKRLRVPYHNQEYYVENPHSVKLRVGVYSATIQRNRSSFPGEHVTVIIPAYYAISSVIPDYDFPITIPISPKHIISKNIFPFYIYRYMDLVVIDVDPFLLSIRINDITVYISATAFTVTIPKDQYSFLADIPVIDIFK